jgi:hypothetical protein
MKSIFYVAVILLQISFLAAQSNCSYNGIFNPQTNSCDCDPGWTGADCRQLLLGPAAPNSGYRPNFSDAWGGAVLKDDQTGVYHMWVSVMANYCDISYWARNSKIIHATSLNPAGPYIYQDEVFPVMAHEIDVKRGPNGTWLAFLTAGVDNLGNFAYSSYGTPCICDSVSQNALSICGYGSSTEATVLSVANSPSGPWSDPIVLLKPDTLGDGIDANFSAVVHPDSSLVGLWRTYPGGSQVHWVTATNFLDPQSYTWQDDEQSLFSSPYDGLTPEGLEDMFVWYDTVRSVYHAVLHDMVAQSGPFYDGLGHAYSLDGTHWTYTGEAASTNVQYTNGSVTTSARARPHLLFENGRITHLISAEQEDINGWNYTLVEPVLSNITAIENPTNKDMNLQVYPNPSHGFVQIKSERVMLSVEVLSLDGRLHSLYPTLYQKQIEIRLEAGFYILRVKTSTGFYYDKVLVR